MRLMRGDCNSQVKRLPIESNQRVTWVLRFIYNKRLSLDRQSEVYRAFPVHHKAEKKQ